MRVVQIVVDVVLVALAAGLLALLLALTREVGRIQVRLGPLGASMTEAGPRTDELAPVFDGLTDQEGRTVSVGGRRERTQLVLFTSTTCTTCLALMPGVAQLAELGAEGAGADGFEVVVVSDGHDAEHREFLELSGLGRSVSYLSARHVGTAYQVSGTPYGVVISPDGRLTGKGVCNRVRQVRELLGTAGIEVGEVPETRPLPLVPPLSAVGGHAHDEHH
ncbi:hypothetical protein [Streptomyces sp. NPDC047043]|uniref:hypothetical protein n=1 Tax=Streptomyces sp. NPDC047043 TaxID=3154497 RepID=UPI0033CDADE3